MAKLTKAEAERKKLWRSEQFSNFSTAKELIDQLTAYAEKMGMTLEELPIRVPDDSYSCGYIESDIYTLETDEEYNLRTSQILDMKIRDEERKKRIKENEYGRYLKLKAKYG